MKKRILSILLAFVMVVGLLPATALAAAEDNAIKLELVRDTTTFAGKEVLRMDFYAKTGTDTPDNHMVYLKYDASKLYPAAQGNGADASSAATNFSVNKSSTFTKNNFAKDDGFGGTEASEVMFYTIIKDGYGYICWKVTEPTDAPAFAEFTHISSIFFGLKEGVSFDAIPRDAIGYSDPAVDGSITSASSAAEITVNGGGAGNVFKYKDKNGTDTMTVAPAVTAGKGVTIAKSAYSGTVDAPTVSKNTGGSVELTAQAISGETVEYGYSTSNDASAVSNWQTGTTFSGLTVGTTYYFFTRVTETAEHQAKASTGTSVVPVAATLTGITISGDNTATVPTKDNTTTVNLTATGSYNDGTNSSVTNSATWTVDPAYAGVSVSNGVVTIQPSAAAGSVTIKAEYGGQSNTHTITLSKATATLTTLTISGSDSVSVPGEYTYTASGEDQYGESISTGSVTWNIEGTAPIGVSIGSSDGKLSITNSAEAGSVTIRATSGTVSNTKTVTITKAASVVSSVIISGGVSSLTVPTVDAIGGEASVNASAAFNAELKDQYGATISGTVTWSVSGNPGVTISDTGLLSITNEATDNNVTVTATAENGKTKTASVTINKATSAANFVQVKKNGTVVTTDSIIIPTSGSAATTVTYIAEVYDQYGAPYTSDTPTWSITSTAGVSVSAGTVSVDNTASAGTSVTLTATSSTNTSKTADVTITLSNKPVHNIGSFANSSVSITYGDAITGQSVNSTTGTVKYFSSDSSAVEVNETTGALTVRKATTSAVTITAKVAEDDTHAEASATYTITVNTKELEITGLTATDRDYAAGDTSVTLTDGELAGKVGTDDVSVTMPTTGTISDANAGSGKAVTVTTPSLSGSAAGNYTLKAISGITVTINKINPDVGTVSGPSSTIYTSTALTGITLSKTGTASGTLELTAGQTLVVGTNSYNWTFTPGDSTNYNTVTGTVSLTVNEDTLTGISIGSTTPSKTSYKFGETFDPAGLTVTASYSSGASKTLTSSEYTVTNGTMTMGQTEVTLSYQGQTCTVSGLTVSKADAPTLSEVAVSQRYTVTTGEKALGNAGMPANAGTLTYTKGSESKTGSVTVSSWAVDTNGKVTYTLSGGAAGDTVTLPVTISSTNYGDTTVNVKITLTDKETPTANANNITVTYTGSDVPASAITGTTSVDGAWSWKTTAPKNVADSGSHTVVFTPNDASAYEIVEDTITVTINKATPTGTPTYTAITTSGKTLGDAALAVGSITPAGGSIAWDLGDSHTVAANTSYSWTYTPADTANYNNLTGSIELWHKSTGGGGGGGGSYTPTYSVTVDKTENGSVTVSPKNASKGSAVTVTVKPDKGYELDTLRVTDKDGDRIKITEKSDGKYIFTMPGSKVTVEATFEEIEPEQPVVKNPFVDVKAGDYFYDAVLWAANEGITGGTSATTFSPNAPCTRAQIVTFLWRAAGSPAPKSSTMPFTDVAVGSYYYDAVLWAVENGVTSGTSATTFSPNATCTRAQAVTFLYRASGAPAVSGNAAFSDVATNAYYAAAVKWAEKNGITGGIGGGLFGSDNNCTRAQIVTFLYRSVK